MRKRWCNATFRFFAMIVAGFSWILPRHAKRIVFITSLYMQMQAVTNVHRDYFETINKILRLAHDVNALQLPAVIHRYLWLDRPIEYILATEISCQPPSLHCLAHNRVDRKVCEEIVDLTPACMRYGRKDDMIEDVYQLMCVIGASAQPVEQNPVLA